MHPVALPGLAVLGLLVGSFVTVLIARVPSAEPVARPWSSCPHCGTAARPRDALPVVSWLLLRGRCRDCTAPIPVRHPLVELAVATLFVLVAVHLGPTPVLPAFLYLAAVGTALAVIDLDTHRLPDALVKPSYAVGLVLLGGASAATGDWPALVRGLLGGVALVAAYGALWVAHPAGMGRGDVKLAGVLGLHLAWLGWGPFAVGAFAAFLLGGAFAVTLLALGRVGRRSGIPFGPWMLLGAAVGVAWGEPLWRAYLGIPVGP